MQNPIKVEWPKESSEKGGCKEGYCWAGCAGLIPDVNGKEWCWTDDGSGNKKTCTFDVQCDKCAPCVSLCTI